MVIGVSDSSNVTHESLSGQRYLRDLSRYLRIRRKFWDELNSTGSFLIDFLITQSVSDCRRAGLGDKARELLSQAEFENASLPKFDELDNSTLEKMLLSRLALLAHRLESGKRGRHFHQQALLQKSLESTLADLKNLGLEREAKKTIKRSASHAKAKRQHSAIDQK